MSQPHLAQFGHQWHWETGACECCGSCSCTDCGICCQGCLCPCCLYGRTAGAIDNSGDCCGSCFGYFLLSFCCLHWCVAKDTRKQMRDRFGLRPEGACGCGDCCTHFCCSSCSLCQEARELNMRAQAGAAGQQVAMAPSQQFMHKM